MNRKTLRFQWKHKMIPINGLFRCPFQHPSMPSDVSSVFSIWRHELQRWRKYSVLFEFLKFFLFLFLFVQFHVLNDPFVVGLVPTQGIDDWLTGSNTHYGKCKIKKVLEKMGEMNRYTTRCLCRHNRGYGIGWWKHSVDEDHQWDNRLPNTIGGDWVEKGRYT